VFLRTIILIFAYLKTSKSHIILLIVFFFFFGIKCHASPISLLCELLVCALLLRKPQPRSHNKYKYILTELSNLRFEVLTAVLLRIGIF
jgi:hypothetical protein